ncbi:MAG: hypothetical protein ACQEUZ_15790 [Pseudomonadota bacterium]
MRALAGARGARPARWSDTPAPGRVLPALLPRALPGHPVVAFGLGDAAPEDTGPLLAAIRRDRLWWPAVRAGARAPEALVDLRGAARAEADALLDLLAREAPGARARALVQGGPGAAAACAHGLPTARRLSEVRPEALALALGLPFSPLLHHAALGGVRTLSPQGPADPTPWLARARFLGPWRSRPVPAAEGLTALALLRAEAQRNDRPVVTAGLSRWKRRNAAPFLAGPAGPPEHRARPGRAAARARALDGRLALWSTREAPPGAPETLRLEDGFIRSVGLGLRHAPPASLVADREGLHFDATRPTDFERLAREAGFPPDLLARAAALRRRLVALGITKYNLARSAPLPRTDRTRVLVAGQVEGDASLRLGARGVATNAALLRAARARHPDAFLLYKPHPDVLTGLRPGAVDGRTLARTADAVAPDASAEACLDWADRLEVMTSLMGFEALLRGKPVATHGRPFYAGWGLTESPEPFDRGRRLALDELVAAALILYPRYIDPITRLPAPPELVLDRLDAERAFARTPAGRTRNAWRALLSRALNVVR